MDARRAIHGPGGLAGEPRCPGGRPHSARPRPPAAAFVTARRPRGCPGKILIQLDCDPQPSTFDAIVAVDAGADVLLRHGGVTAETRRAARARRRCSPAAEPIWPRPRSSSAAPTWRPPRRSPARCERRSSARCGSACCSIPSGANTTASAAVVAAGAAPAARRPRRRPAPAGGRARRHRAGGPAGGPAARPAGRRT